MKARRASSTPRNDLTIRLAVVSCNCASLSSLASCPDIVDIPSSYSTSSFCWNLPAASLASLPVITLPAAVLNCFCCTRIRAASDTSAAYTAASCLRVSPYFSAVLSNRVTPSPSSIRLAKYSVIRWPFSGLTPSCLAKSVAAALRRWIVPRSRPPISPSGKSSLRMSTLASIPSSTSLGSIDAKSLSLVKRMYLRPSSVSLSFFRSSTARLVVSAIRLALTVSPTFRVSTIRSAPLYC